MKRFIKWSNRIKNHNKSGIKIVVIVAVVALLVGIFFQQAKHGIKVDNFTYLIKEVEQIALDDYIKTCSDLNDEQFLYLRYDNRFPSENADDYREIAIYANIHNSSLLNYTLYDSYISDAEKNSIVCFAITNDFQEKVKPMSNENYVYLMNLFVYIGDKKDMNEDEYIKDNIKNWNIDAYFFNKLFKNNKYTCTLADEKTEQLSANPYE